MARFANRAICPLTPTLSPESERPTHLAWAGRGWSKIKRAPPMNGLRTRFTEEAHACDGKYTAMDRDGERSSCTPSCSPMQSFGIDQRRHGSERALRLGARSIDAVHQGKACQRP